MSKPYKTVSVCGCGWLGLPLAEYLLSKGYAVTGSKRTDEGVALLKNKGIEGVVFDIFNTDSAQTTNVLFDTDVFIANIPPGRKTLEGDGFVTAMKAMIDAAKAGNVKQFIFVSTTSVYGEVKGNVIESTECHPDTASGRAHRELETYVQAQFPENGVIVRFSGLVGGSRHPAKFLAGREGIANGKDPVNLVHRDDCISAMEAIIGNQLGGEILHLSASKHPTREAYYQWAAAELGLPEPQFVAEGGEGKRICPDFSLKALGIELRYPSPYLMPLQG